MALACVCSLCISPYNGTINALIAETADYTYRTKKEHVDGTMFSCSSIGVKVGGGIGSAVAGILLEIGGFDGAASVQSAGTLNMILFMYVILPIIIRFVLCILIYFLKVEKANKDWDAAH